MVTIRPGVDENSKSSSNSITNTKYRNSTTIDTMLDLVRNMFPPNIVQACLEQFQTILVPPANKSGEFKKRLNVYVPKII